MIHHIENFKIKYELFAEILVDFIFLIIVLLFLIWLIFRFVVICRENNPFISIIISILIISWIYFVYIKFSWKDIIILYMEKSYNIFFEKIIGFIIKIDAGVWVLENINEAFLGFVTNFITKNEDPKSIKNDIEKLISEQNFDQNTEMKKLYKTLQVNALSLEKQKRNMIYNILKNFFLSLLFFILGLIIPKIVAYLFNIF